MFALPLIAPPPEDQLFSNIYLPRSDSPPPSLLTTNPHNAHAQQSTQHRQQRQQRDEEKRLLQTRSPLALLAQDEAAIASRKAAIRNFGAYWIRPPGISKTLQAMIEEDVERREQEELERQEQGLRDLQAQQQLEEAQQRAAETAALEQEEGQEGERDLDDDVPEAGDDVTFNEDSMLQDSHVADEDEEEQAVMYEQLEEAELLGVTREEENLGIEHDRDLDDEVPNAESFMDSGADDDGEEDTSEISIQNSFALPVQRQSALEESTTRPEAGGLFGRTRMLQRSLAAGLPRSPGSMILSSPQIESSFAASSPVRQRNNRSAAGRSMRRGPVCGTSSQQLLA